MRLLREKLRGLVMVHLLIKKHLQLSNIFDINHPIFWEATLDATSSLSPIIQVEEALYTYHKLSINCECDKKMN